MRLNCRLWSALAFVFISTTIHAQILKNPKEYVWNFVGSYQQTGSATTDYIGNYPCFNTQDSIQTESFKQIANEHSGTLFIVGKLKAGYSSGSLMELGGLRVEKDTVFCANSPIETQSLTEKPFILKIKYQTSFKKKWDKKNIFISNYFDIAEIVYYKRPLSKKRSRTVESYLALKYSINITQNSDQILRTYLDKDSTFYWNPSADGNYDQEVMAIGRLDFMQWEQGQTYTSDASSIGISLEDPMVLGNKPNVKIGDKSMLIISNRITDRISWECGGETYQMPWKFKFFDWNTQAQWLHVEWDSIMNLINPPRFTNGYTDLALTYSEVNGITKVDIPLGDIPNVGHQTWYLLWDNTLPGCDPLATLLLGHCGANNISTNNMRVEVDTSALPSTYELKDMNTGKMLSGNLNNTELFLDNIPTGQYTLHVYNAEGNWIEQIVQMNECENQTGGFSDINIQTGSKANLSDTDWLEARADQYIQVFPNPVGQGRQFTVKFSPELKGEEFTLQIIDQSAKTVFSETIQPNEELEYKNSILNSGEYILRFTGESITEVKQILVK